MSQPLHDQHVLELARLHVRDQGYDEGGGGGAANAPSSVLPQQCVLLPQLSSHDSQKAPKLHEGVMLACLILHGLIVGTR